MVRRRTFVEMQAEQAKMTESWKAEGRLSEAWVVADPEIVELFSAGVAFGMEVGRRGRTDPAYSPDEWRRAMREAVERAATLEDKLEKARRAVADAIVAALAPKIRAEHPDWSAPEWIDFAIRYFSTLS